MDFLQRNFFILLRSEHFHSEEEMDSMTTFKRKKIDQMLKNVKTLPQGEVAMSNGFLNRRLQKIQDAERHSIDTSTETIYFLRLIVGNINATLANGINLMGIIQIGLYLRNKGDKVDYVKLERWIEKLHIQRFTQLIGSVLIIFFDFEQDEVPFVHRIERGAYKLTLLSLYYNIQDQQKIQFEQGETGFVHTSGNAMRKNLRRSMRYFDYAPIETTSHFVNNIFRSLAELEE